MYKTRTATATALARSPVTLTVTLNSSTHPQLVSPPSLRPRANGNTQCVLLSPSPAFSHSRSPRLTTLTPLAPLCERERTARAPVTLAIRHHHPHHLSPSPSSPSSPSAYKSNGTTRELRRALCRRSCTLCACPSPARTCGYTCFGYGYGSLLAYLSENPHLSCSSTPRVRTSRRRSITSALILGRSHGIRASETYLCKYFNVLDTVITKIKNRGAFLAVRRGPKKWCDGSKFRDGVDIS